MSCSKGCTNSCSCENEKTFSSLVNYDGAKIPCIDVEGAIKPPFTNLNVVIELIAAKVCELIALGGVPGPAGTNGTNGTNGDLGVTWAYESNSVGSSVSGGTATGTVNGAEWRYGVSDKTFFINFKYSLSVTGNIGDTLALDIDLQHILPTDIIADDFESIAHIECTAVPIQPPLVTRATAVASTKQMIVQAVELTANYVNEPLVVRGQIFLETV